jgi:hypothetical protein
MKIAVAIVVAIKKTTIVKDTDKTGENENSIIPFAR